MLIGIFGNEDTPWEGCPILMPRIEMWRLSMFQPGKTKDHPICKSCFKFDDDSLCETTTWFRDVPPVNALNAWQFQALADCPYDQP
jgi:hypothetical protein